ncbi:hypothetical protein P7K49_012951 [Saguinus oedipus]|uniref:Uncharacterized protein n=1 Tax=Saguinus oedipus TaxID=9490 RepID=A0ABQ9VEI5_SAGOE|nr:hypothetical protein P7K49_012951 [Saguinus oedipus]
MQLELENVDREGHSFPGPEDFCPLAASMVPQRKSNFSQIVLRALFTGACVSLVNACMAGKCRPGRLRMWNPDFLVSPEALPTHRFPTTGILYVPRGAEVNCMSLLNMTLSSSSFEVYLCCRNAFQSINPEFSPEALQNCCQFYNHTIWPSSGKPRDSALAQSHNWEGIME